jgi:hypothetical protein
MHDSTSSSHLSTAPAGKKKQQVEQLKVQLCITSSSTIALHCSQLWFWPLMHLYMQLLV